MIKVIGYIVSCFAWAMYAGFHNVPFWAFLVAQIGLSILLGSATYEVFQAKFGLKDKD